MEKDLRIKHSVSSVPYKVWEYFFHRKVLHEKTNFFLVGFFGRCFSWGLMIRSCKGGSSWLRSFKGRVKLVFPFIDPDLSYWYIILKVNTTDRGLNLNNTFCKLCLSGQGFHVKSVFFFKNYRGDLFFDVLIIGLF